MDCDTGDDVFLFIFVIGTTDAALIKDTHNWVVIDRKPLLIAIGISSIGN